MSTMMNAGMHDIPTLADAWRATRDRYRTLLFDGRGGTPEALALLRDLRPSEGPEAAQKRDAAAYAQSLEMEARLDHGTYETRLRYWSSRGLNGEALAAKMNEQADLQREREILRAKNPRLWDTPAPAAR